MLQCKINILGDHEGRSGRRIISSMKRWRLIHEKLLQIVIRRLLCVMGNDKSWLDLE